MDGGTVLVLVLDWDWTGLDWTGLDWDCKIRLHVITISSSRDGMGSLVYLVSQTLA
jgi:hypothetical protein